nr:MAG TPA: hypothetical protein [Caudoviricetes sp.]
MPFPFRVYLIALQELNRYLLLFIKSDKDFLFLHSSIFSPLSIV